jgi:hypothetical protein
MIELDYLRTYSRAGLNSPERKGSRAVNRLSDRERHLIVIRRKNVAPWREISRRTGANVASVRRACRSTSVRVGMPKPSRRILVRYLLAVHDGRSGGPNIPGRPLLCRG